MLLPIGQAQQFHLAALLEPMSYAGALLVLVLLALDQHPGLGFSVLALFQPFQNYGHFQQIPLASKSQPMMDRIPMAACYVGILIIQERLFLHFRCQLLQRLLFQRRPQVLSHPLHPLMALA